ncbi:four-carbon acid sugar kinase family protein [Paraburkholderia sp. PREW-6R]|uniref:four-carbon acid sugar kinase family protein n=1 Tax=Paraburkholderia sp. PREW-6R TaxID=3141544 RepID=UPI0031F4F3CE
MQQDKSRDLRIAFYGDDFTGSTDALEVLAFSGLRCALFLKAPTRAQLDALGGFDAIGIAGASRAMSPTEMDDALPAVFSAMRELRAPLVHYKVCSTFDSAPNIGSIGHVMEIARATFGDATIPIVAGTPALLRYCLFGNLFARSGTDGQIYRIDRHPIMSVHPVTPMDEADLIRHFNRQTELRIASFNLTQFEGGRPAVDRALDAALADKPAGLLFDTAHSGHLTEVGRLLETMSARAPVTFTVGSSGVEYALTQWWAETGRLPAVTRSYDECAPATPILAVSGSASPLSAVQIDTAIAAGFTDLAVDACELVHNTRWHDALQRLVDRASIALRSGQSVVMHTARGPQDPRVAAMIDSLTKTGLSRDEAKHQGGRLLGQRLGAIVEAILQAVPLRRLILSGGDTSSMVTQVLGPDALEIDARLTPGAPLCRVISARPHLRDLEIALKGGQMGGADYFVVAQVGRSAG